ncbi:MAG: helix-turn-helix domain-containing protein [Acidimicrobiales bacterium]
MKLLPVLLVEAGGDPTVELLSRIDGAPAPEPAPVAPPSGEPLTMSLSEAAKVLGIGVSTAYRLCSRGEFPVPLLRIGGTVKVSRKRLWDYVEGTDDRPARAGSRPGT